LTACGPFATIVLHYFTGHTAMSKRHRRSPSWANPFRLIRDRRRDARTIEEWRKSGAPLPPPHVLKQQVVRDYAARFGLKTLVETGTFKGDMIHGVERHFAEVHSIELGRELYDDARERFAGLPHIHLHLGDSASVLPEVLKSLRAPALFWLDGHYSEGITARGSKDTPIVEELAAIYRHNPTGHVILIDDARHFTGQGDYPSVETLRTKAGEWSPGAQLEMADDIIRLSHGPAAPKSNGTS
jgi:hypothetical protein